MPRIWIPLLMAVFLAPVVLRADEPYDTQKADLRRIKERMIDGWTLRRSSDSRQVREQLKRLDEHVAGYLAVPGGYWSVWTEIGQPELSLTGAAFAVPAELARAYRSPGSRYHRSRDVMAAVEGGLRHLDRFAHPGCKQPGNWWAWQIGMPMNLIATLVLLEGELDRALFDRELATLVYLLKAEDGVRLTGAFVRPQQVDAGRTDMNALWGRRLRCELGILLENPALAGKWAVAAAAEMGRPGNGALQEDGSYKFHGQKPMWAYGRAFLLEYAMLLGRCDGTFLAPSAEETDRYAGMLERFVNGFLYRGRLCPAMTGREISRGNAESADMSAALGIMARVQHARSAEFAALYARETGLADPASEGVALPGATDRRWIARPAGSTSGVPAAEPAPQVSDNFVYPDSDYLQITRPDWAMGIKMHSSRNAGYESINGENLQGWFLSHGSTFHYLRGDEWADCWPTIDWTRLPGTTVSDQVKKQSQSAFVGVLRGSNRVALAAMELKRDGFAAHKSWLVDGEAVICLGSDIRGPGRVETTVLNQPVPADAPLLIDDQPAPAEPLDRMTTVRSLWLGNMGYVFPGGARVRLLRETRTSDWSSIRDPKRHGPGQVVTRHYVTLVIIHDQDTPGYRYIMLPDVERSAWPARAAAALQAYGLATHGAHTVRSRDGQVESIVLWSAGEAGRIRADRGCLALNVAGAWQVVDPAWSGLPLNVSVDGRQQELAPVKGRPVRLGP